MSDIYKIVDPESGETQLVTSKEYVDLRLQRIEEALIQHEKEIDEAHTISSMFNSVPSLLDTVSIEEMISPTIDPNSRTFYVEAEFSNANQKLRPGMFGRAELNLGRANTVLVSDKAVVKQNGTNDKYVYVLQNNNTVEYRKITLGRRMNDKYAVLDGLNDGEKVVVSEYFIE